MQATTDTGSTPEFLDAFDIQEIPDIPIAAGSITAVVLAYNELLRFPHFLDHHRKAGVSLFLVIDNGSTDGSAEYLDAQLDVVRFPSSRSYKEFKSHWRHLIADQYLQGHWVMFPDVDELMVYPGWPEKPLTALTSFWRKQGVQGVFSTMVDMYPEAPLSGVQYSSGTPFLSLCSYFDRVGYRLLPLSKYTERNFPTPPFQLYGGARERLFPVHGKRKASKFDVWLEQFMFAPNAGSRPRFLQRLARKFLKASWPKDSASMGKMPLLLWSSEFRFAGGVHRLNQVLNIADDWVALLHFKYLDDFAERTIEATKRAQHANNSGHYRHYVEHMDEIVSKGALYSKSVRFSAVSNLEDAGLMRTSAPLKQWMASDPASAQRSK
ncbi:glycosyltransferase family 2 protein [Roseibium polysiphoniae]|uniref:glycosyltransferase family 2 protein n=1 Tax=Roseibium polysiphoniae TaxID=2571221 RepID=UPI0032992A3B